MSALDTIPNDLAKAVRRDLASLSQLNTPSIRQTRRRYSRSLRPERAELVYHFVCSLLDGAGWAERVVAWEVLASHRGAFELLDDDKVEKMVEGLSDWGSIDLFGVTIVGQAWREGLVSDQKILSWTISSDHWHRRLALVATVPLNSKARGGKGDTRRTLRVCRKLLDDRDDMVVKAMSWALRELSKTDPIAVQEFIEREQDRLASRIKREVRNKLDLGRKRS